jgi:signal transduction histidine kinase
MLEFFTKLFDTSGFPPRWHCGLWTAGHGWLHILSDLGIWAAYFAIPIILLIFASKRPDVPFRKVFLLFGAFILACGTTHFLEAVIFWQPVYRFAGLVKLVTAIVSWATIYALIPILPAALSLRSPSMLEAEVTRRTTELATANAALREESEQRQQLSEELRRVAADLSEANRRKTEFLAVLAHELRNPLTPVRNSIEILKLTAGDEEIRNDIVATMDRQTNHMVRLVDDLLDISRINQGRLLLRKQPVTIQSVLESAVEAVRPALDAAGHDLTLEIPTEPIVIDGDPTRLSQIFANLLGNSAKYTDDGGRIRLTVTRRDGSVIVAVQDNGRGIPPEMQSHVFDMFAQLEQTSERLKSGLGIGLTLVRRLTEMHNGEVHLTSPGTDAGTTVTVTLPALEASSVELTTSTPPVDATPRRILVVDDNRDAAVTLEAMLRKWGHDVSVAHDGVQAVDAARTRTPDLILMDIGMPNMNGYEAARLIRSEPWGRAIRLVALSGWGQERDRERARDAGFDRHLIKPGRAEEIRSIIASL